MTDKEEIIIDGKKEKVNILFECNHIEDIEAFDMIKQGIEITPQNAPVGDFKIKIISNNHSPYGFSSICSRSKKSEDWEYMGFGHSGACSVTTALLKALQRKEQECEKLKEENEELNKKNNFLLQRLEVDDTETSLVFKLQRELENSKSEFYHAINSELRYKQALDEIEKRCCAVLNGDEKILYAYQIKEIISKAKDGSNE